MKKNIIRILIIGCLLATAGLTASDSERGKPENWYVFYPNFPIGNLELDNVYGLNLGLPVSEKVKNVYGVDFGLLVSNVPYVSGLQFSIICNTSKEVKGVQFAAVNTVNGNVNRILLIKI